MASLLSSHCKNNPPIRIVSRKEAEAIKLFSNAYLAMRVCYWNELACFAESEGPDLSSLISSVSDDPRIGNFYNRPGKGCGGSCLPKDVLGLNASIRKSPRPLLEAIPVSNEERKAFVKRK